MELKIVWEPTQKQAEAWDYLHDRTSTEIFFGGGAGGGKSHLGCVWIITSCLQYPNSRWLMGRAVLKNLKESTLLTFWQICKEWGLKKDKDFTFNNMENVVRFSNGSEVYLKDLFLYPSDPEFDSFGSTEYTGIFIDEASQISAKAKNVVSSRIRYKLEEFGLIPKMFISSNPSKNFLYYEFFKPWKMKALPSYRKFVQALVGDNPHISPQYRNQLMKLDKVTKERLLFGNFDFDSDPSRLMEYDKIIDLFTNAKQPYENKYLTADIARFGRDATVIFLWHGLNANRCITLKGKSTKETRLKLEALAAEEQIPRSNIIVDEDGIGGGVFDEMEGIKGFVNNSRAAKDENYVNLKSQCYFHLADHINKGLISVSNIDSEQKEKLIEDLEQVKRDNIDKEGKAAVVSKDKVKENLGRSPDYSDAMMLRMYYHVNDYGTPRMATRGWH